MRNAIPTRQRLQPIGKPCWIIVKRGAQQKGRFIVPRGGARAGAGRKPGGLRAKPRETIALARAEVRKVLSAAKSPMAVLCEIAADESRDAVLRVQAAAAVCPFLYPRLSASVVADVSPTLDRPTTAALLSKLSQQFARLSAPGETIDALPEPEAAKLIEGEG
jgi:hypothetical protein